MDQRKGRKRLCALLLVGVLLGYIVCDLVVSNYTLGVTRYSVETDKLSSPVTIVQLGDLHNAVFGRDNERLVERVAALAPDLILITGDLVTARTESCETAYAFVERLAALAPVYCALGNHELLHEEYFPDEDLVAGLSEHGAVVMYKRSVIVQTSGGQIAIGGVSGSAYQHSYLRAYSAHFLDAFIKNTSFTLLLAHEPDGMLLNGGMALWPVDLVLCGHTHGGQVRLPFLGAVYLPSEGFFPKYADGLFRFGAETVIITRGLGTSSLVPRFCNRPEIVAITLTPTA